MAYKLTVSKQVAKFLDKSDKKLTTKIMMALDLLAQEPFSEKLDAKLLVNKQGHFRLRIRTTF
jgi:mRNA-degrading endonuclease RelE of RelBE toxin-antitoxin system